MINELKSSWFCEHDIAEKFVDWNRWAIWCAFLYYLKYFEWYYIYRNRQMLSMWICMNMNINDTEEHCRIQTTFVSCDHGTNIPIIFMWLKRRKQPTKKNQLIKAISLILCHELSTIVVANPIQANIHELSTTLQKTN